MRPEDAQDTDRFIQDSLNTRKWLFYVILTLGLPVSALAVGFRLPNQNPDAIARGNAFVATADNASAIYYNPAGITQLRGHQVTAGLYFISADTEYRSATGATAETDSDFQAVPQFHYVFAPTNSMFAFGLGVYVPYGLSIDWGKNTSFSTLAEKGDLLYTTVNPVVAVELHPTLSLAIGPTINYSEVEFKRAIGLVPGDEFRVKGDDFAYGFNAGLRWQPYEEWAFGVSYRYATTMDYDGKSELSPFSPSTTTTAELRFPQHVVAGVSFRPTGNWNLEVNVDWTDWDNLNDVVFKGVAGGDQTFLFNYESSLMYELGVTRMLPKGFYTSVGYIFSENSSPDRYFNPIVPDSDLHLGSVGFGRKGVRWDWAAAYHFAYSSGREVKNSLSSSLIGETADGNYETLNHAFNVSATFKF